MNVQPALIPGFNLRELPFAAVPELTTIPGEQQLESAIKAIQQAKKTVVKVGGGCRGASRELSTFLELADAVAVVSPLAAGEIPFSSRRNMTVGGSKGSISGNFAMDEADLLIAAGTRFV
jgi:3D-(3,5/4)-trihydroxycyclohexane-1,2-dione acylhydrolase (decyclizing)